MSKSSLKKFILEPAQLERYAQLKTVVKQHRESFWQFAEALAEIHAEKYWMEDYHTWNDFCRMEAGFTASRYRQLQRASKFREEMKQLADRGTSVPVPETEREAREMLSKVTAEPSDEVIEPDELNLGVTTVTTPSTPKKPTPPWNGEPAEVDTKGKDRMGYPLPKEISDEFNRWHEMRRMADKLSAVLQHIKAAKDNHDRLYAHLTNGIFVDLEGVIYTLKAAIPYAVCPYCQGRNLEQCTNCSHTGYVGQFAFEHLVPIEVRNMRKAQIEGLKK